MYLHLPSIRVSVSYVGDVELNNQSPTRILHIKLLNKFDPYIYFHNLQTLYASCKIKLYKMSIL